MSTQLNFAHNFAHRMVIIAIIVGLAISLMTPVTYGIMGWREFYQRSVIYGEEMANKVGRTAMESPELWYYTVPRFILPMGELRTQQEIRSIKVYDKTSKLKYEQTVTPKATMTHLFRTPVKYNNKLYGFIEIEQSAQSLVSTIFTLTFFFTILGITTGIFLYRLPVAIIRLAEKGVHNHADQAKKQADIEVARLDRLSLIGQMAAAIGHEIRNPLTTVRGYLQFFSQKTQFAALISQFDLMISELDRANSIISEFLSLAHNRAITMKPCNLTAIVKAFEPLIHSDALLHGLSLIVNVQAVPDTLLDEKEIRQLLLNIARNGLEAMQPGGCLCIETYIDGKDVALSVTDQGRGIDPDLIAKLGTPFLTTKQTGTGLGLAVCYSIAHRHRAKIDFLTSPGGTTCIVRFPLFLSPITST